MTLKMSMWLAATALATQFPAIARAQEVADARLAPDETAASQDNVIVVTAQKRSESILDVPVSVQVIGAELFDQTQGADIRDIVRLSPSFQLSSGFSINGGTPRIRGIGTEAFGQASEPSVLIVVDDVPRLRSDQNFFDLIDLERVEILRGAQSTLFGRGASAGVVNIVTKKPGDSFEGKVDFLIAEQDEYRVRGYLAGPIAPNLGASLAVSYRESGAWIDNANDDVVFPDASTFTIRGKVVFEPSANFSMTLTGDFSETDSNSFPFLYIRADSPVLTGAIAPVVAGPDNRTANVQGDLVYTDTESYGGDLNIRLGLGGVDLVSVTSYREFEFLNNNDVDGTPDTGAGGIGFVTLNRTFNTELDRFYTQELRIETTGDNVLDFTGGLYFDGNEIDARLDRTLCLVNIDCAKDFRIPISPTASILGASLTDTLEQVDQDSVSLFGQMDYEITPEFEITAGLRWQRTKTDTTTTNLVTNVAQSREFDDTGWSGKIAGQYFITPDSSIYASYARGFKGRTSSTIDPSIPIVDPETSDNFEVGYKAVFDRSTSLNVTAFFSKFQDFQAQGLTPLTNQFILTNVGEVETKGIEIDLSSQVTENLSLVFGGAWIDAEITEYPNGQCFTPLAEAVQLFPTCTGAAPFADLAGGELPNSPEFKLNFNARYEDEINDSGLAAFAQLNVSWQSEVQFSLNQNPNTIQGDYALTDITIGLRAPANRYAVSLFVRNLFDQNYFGFISQNILIGSSVNLWGIPARDAQRYVGATFSASF